LNLQQHVRTAAAALLQRFDQQVRQAMLLPDETAIHDLRVSVRRLRECLGTFAPLFPVRHSKQIRKQLRKIMRRAGSVRSCDIAMELLKQAGVGQADSLWREIQLTRGVERTALLKELTKLGSSSYSARWKASLRL
jgi:CHAD domain-containing protein